MITKICTKCGIEKIVNCFYERKTGKHGVRNDCKDCNNKNSKLYQRVNKNVLIDRKHIKYEKEKEQIAIKRKHYYAENKSKILAHKKVYRQKYPDKINAKVAARKAQKLKATPSWADKECIADLYKLAAIFNSTGINIHVDHIVPLKSKTVCGLHCESNLQLLSASDNISKGNRYWPDMW